MKIFTNKQMLLVAACITAAFFQSCKKEQQSAGPITGTDSLTSYHAAALTASYTVSNFVSGLGQDNLPKVQSPYRICSAFDGTMYVSSPNSSGIVYKITPNGKATNLLNIDRPYGIKAGENGTVYFTNIPFVSNTATIKKIDKNKVVTTIPVSIGLSDALDLAITPDSTLYITDQYNRRIVKLTKQGVATVFAGKTGQMGLVDGQGENARFSYPFAIRYANDGTLWVIDGNGLDKGSQTIRKITLDGNVTTFFQLKASEKGFISALAVTKRDKNFMTSPNENAFMFITTQNNVRKHQLFHLSYDKVLTPITGNLPDGFHNGDAAQASFFSPTGITVNENGIFAADLGNNAIRKIARNN